MEKIETLVDKYWPQIYAFFLDLESWHWGAIGGTIALAMIIPTIGRSRKRKARRHAPQLALHTFQVAPLGRDAFFKIRNSGHPAVLSGISIRGRQSLVVKNAVAGHQIETDKEYGILIESAGQEKITPDFAIELTYMDSQRNVYRQVFQPDRQGAKPPKLVKYG